MLRRDLVLSALCNSLLAACAGRSVQGAVTGAPVSASPELAASVRAAREEYGLPALAVLVGRGGRGLDGAVDGVRARGEPQRATIEDRWHIGSCTKSMTATLLARYVDRGEVSWESTVAELLPELAERMNAEARAITLAQLLTATAGLPEYPSFGESEEEAIADIMSIAHDAPTVQLQRVLTAERMLSRAPLTSPGSEFAYSSTGFIIAGAVAERLGGASYEELLAREVLAPLGIQSFGFGAPGSPSLIDQPRGHSDSAPNAPLSPDAEEADNPAFFSPAGRLNITMGDWATYAFDHAMGEAGGGRLLRPETYARLHTPGIEGGQYAFGWGVLVRDGQHALITHNGSNGAWFADIRVYPPTGYVYLMASNDGREDIAKQAFRQVRAALDARYQPA